MKTFKSATTPNSRLLRVENLDHKNLHLRIVGDDNTRTTISIAPSDAPALALAVLEAAVGDGPGASNEIDTARLALIQEGQRTEREAVEAKEQSELEAEALDFLNVSRKAKHLGPLGNFDDHTKDAWLAVARRAREMRKNND